jgi:hypothetical protein
VAQVYTRQTDFIISKEIIRSANNTMYKKSFIVNNVGASTLPFFDFSTIGSTGNKVVTIKTIVLTSDNGGTVRISPLFYFYNSPTLTGSVLTDNSFFNPSYSQSIAKQVATIEPLPTVLAYGNLIYIVMQNELVRIGQLDATGKLYFAMLCDENYTPKISEHFFITIKGFIS